MTIGLLIFCKTFGPNQKRKTKQDTMKVIMFNFVPLTAFQRASDILTRRLSGKAISYSFRETLLELLISAFVFATFSWSFCIYLEQNCTQSMSRLHEQYFLNQTEFADFNFEYQAFQIIFQSS